MTRNKHTPTLPTTPPELLEAMKNHHWSRALAIAAGFSQLGKHRDAITRGHQAVVRPDFYLAIHKDPEALVAAGIAALKERYAS